MKRLNFLIAALIISEVIILFVLFSGKSGTEGEINGWKRKGKEAGDRLHEVPILLYHNIVEDGKKVRSPFAVSRAALVRHFEILKKLDIQVLSLARFADSLPDRRGKTRKSVILTFDDDFRSMHDILLPLAEEYQYPVTLFVYTGGVCRRAGKQGLDWKMLRKMDRSLIDIQCHSLSHPDLTKLEAGGTEFRQELFDELYLSRLTIEKYLGKKVRFFAFPYGRYSLTLLELAHKAGYERVFSTDYGSNIVTRDNFCLRRHHIKHTYSDEFFAGLVR